MNIYSKSKCKIIGFIFSCFITIILILLILSIFLDYKDNLTLVIFIPLFGIYLSIIQISPQFSQKILIQHEELVFYNCYDKKHNPPVDIIVRFNDIHKLSCSGFWLIPMSEIMIVQTKEETVYIDFNFKDYLLIWKEIYDICNTRNSNIVVSKKLLKRINRGSRGN